MRQILGTYACIIKIVSIHAPREGCDLAKRPTQQIHDVSIHAPREGCDYGLIFNRSKYESFNSRTPGGVRQLPPFGIGAYCFGFNSRTPGGVRLLSTSEIEFTIVFQFTHPGRGATWQEDTLGHLFSVSIHAPREGCDLQAMLSKLDTMRFQFTHPGRGATLTESIIVRLRYSFNSRTPGGVRLGRDYIVIARALVSIHAPREGCDSRRLSTPLGVPCFNSRTPGGVRRLAPP